MAGKAGALIAVLLISVNLAFATTFFGSSPILCPGAVTAVTAVTVGGAVDADGAQSPRPGRARLDARRSEWNQGVLRVKLPEFEGAPFSAESFPIGSTATIWVDTDALRGATEPGLSYQRLAMVEGRLHIELQAERIGPRLFRLLGEWHGPDAPDDSIDEIRFAIEMSSEKLAVFGKRSVRELGWVARTLVKVEIPKTTRGFRLVARDPVSGFAVVASELEFTQQGSLATIGQSTTHLSLRQQGLQNLAFSMLLEGSPGSAAADVAQLSTTLDEENFAVFVSRLVGQRDPRYVLPVRVADIPAAFEKWREGVGPLSGGEIERAVRETPAMRTRALFGFTHIREITLEPKLLRLVTVRRL